MYWRSSWFMLPCSRCAWATLVFEAEIGVADQPLHLPGIRMVAGADGDVGGLEQLAAGLGRELDRHDGCRLLAEGEGCGLRDLGQAEDQRAGRARQHRQQALLLCRDAIVVGDHALDQPRIDAVAEEQLAQPRLVAGHLDRLVDQLGALIRIVAVAAAADGDLAALDQDPEQVGVGHDADQLGRLATVRALLQLADHQPCR